MDVTNGNGFGRMNDNNNVGTDWNSHHHQLGQNPLVNLQLGFGGRGTETVNNAANIFNFTFVNSGQYDLNLNGFGSQEVDSQHATGSQEQSQSQSQPPIIAPTTTTGHGGVPLGSAFPNVPALVAPPSTTFSNFNNYGGGSTGLAAPFHFGNQMAMSQPNAGASCIRPPVASAFGANNSTSIFHHSQPPANNFNAHVPNFNAEVPFSHYHQRDQTFRSLSRGSLDNYNDLYERLEAQEPWEHQCQCYSCNMSNPHHHHHHHGQYH